MIMTAEESRSQNKSEELQYLLFYIFYITNQFNFIKVMEADLTIEEPPEDATLEEKTLAEEENELLRDLALMDYAKETKPMKTVADMTKWNPEVSMFPHPSQMKKIPIVDGNKGIIFFFFWGRLICKSEWKDVLPK
jgi:hypothetical protein